MKRITAVTLASAVAVGGIVLAAPAASAKDGDQKARGACTGATPASNWAVKVKPRKGQLRTDFWVKNNATGKPWVFTLTQGGDPVGSPVTKTAGASDDQGSDDTRHAAEVKFRTYVPAGSGELVFTAMSGSETCRTTVTF